MGESGTLIMICCWMIYCTVGWFKDHKDIPDKTQFWSLRQDVSTECVAGSLVFPLNAWHGFPNTILSLGSPSRDQGSYETISDVWFHLAFLKVHSYIRVAFGLEGVWKSIGVRVRRNKPHLLTSKVKSYHFDHSFPIDGHNLLSTYTWFQVQKL